MIKGFDISHHNGDNFIRQRILNEGNIYDFVIIKASEGKTFIDKNVYENIEDAKGHNLKFGLYHYARPEYNTPKEEANNFLKVFNNYIGEAMVCLDWEGEALKYPVKWILDWCEYIYFKTGVKAVLYIQKSYLNSHKKELEEIAARDYGLWIARWAKSAGTCAPWNTWALWQFTSTPFDQDYFNGTVEQFMQYCKADSTEAPKRNVIELSITATDDGGNKWTGKATLNLVSDNE